jgi:hypothetical protein
VTANSNGRFSASAVVPNSSDEEHTIGVDEDFYRRQEAVDRAIEVSTEQIDRRHIASYHHTQG